MRLLTSDSYVVHTSASVAEVTQRFGSYVRGAGQPPKLFFGEVSESGFELRRDYGSGKAGAPLNTGQPVIRGQFHEGPEGTEVQVRMVPDRGRLVLLAAAASAIGGFALWELAAGRASVLSLLGQLGLAALLGLFHWVCFWSGAVEVKRRLTAVISGSQQHPLGQQWTGQQRPEATEGLPWRHGGCLTILLLLPVCGILAFLLTKCLVVCLVYGSDAFFEDGLWIEGDLKHVRLSDGRDLAWQGHLLFFPLMPLLLVMFAFLLDRALGLLRLCVMPRRCPKLLPSTSPALRWAGFVALVLANPPLVYVWRSPAVVSASLVVLGVALIAADFWINTRPCTPQPMHNGNGQTKHDIR